MKPKAREAREHLLKALSALEDPVAYCNQHGHDGYARDAERARFYALGAAKACIEFALRDLGEPIDPFRPLEVGPYIRTIQP